MTKNIENEIANSLDHHVYYKYVFWETPTYPKFFLCQQSMDRRWTKTYWVVLTKLDKFVVTKEQCSQIRMSSG